MKITAEGLALVPTDAIEKRPSEEATPIREQFSGVEGRAVVDERACYRRERVDQVRSRVRAELGQYPKTEDAAC
jgi:hypothetical protein